MRYQIRVGYTSREETFNLDYLTSKFKCNAKYPRNLDTEHLKPLRDEGLFIPNKKANVLENSWQIVFFADDIKRLFFNLLKEENESYLYRHYGGSEGNYSNPIVKEVGCENKYIVEITDLFYPTYDQKGKITDKTIEKHIYRFEIDASMFLPIRNNSYKPDLKSTYRNSFIARIGDKRIESQGVMSLAKNYIEARAFSNRFDSLDIDIVKTHSSVFA